jgi:hypothetical protein
MHVLFSIELSPAGNKNNTCHKSTWTPRGPLTNKTKTLVSKENIGARRKRRSLLFAPTGDHNPCSCSVGSVKLISSPGNLREELSEPDEAGLLSLLVAIVRRHYIATCEPMLQCKISLASVDHKTDYNVAKSILN